MGILKKLARGGNVQYFVAFILVIIIGVYMLMSQRFPSIELLILIIGLALLNVLLGLSYEIRDLKKRL